MPIELRYRTYFAYLDVPKDVRVKLKRRVFRETLQTDSRSVALRRAAPKIAHWKAAIAKARGERGNNDARYWRDALRRAKDDLHRQSILEQIEMEAEAIGAINVENIGEPPSSNREAQDFYAEATGAGPIPTKEHLDEYMGSVQLKSKTADMRRATLARLGEKFPTVADVSRKAVHGYPNVWTGCVSQERVLQDIGSR